ncbi:MAG: glucan biosynthesis protein [Bosea sp. (in: a-proteobacteria)]
MSHFTRRALMTGLSALALSAAHAALAQTPGNGTRPQPAPSPAPPSTAAQPQPSFSYEQLVRRARDMAASAHEASPALPEALAKLDFDAWRDIRFRPERALMGPPQAQAGQPQPAGSPFRMQMFHPGFLFNQPVVVNILRGGVPMPVPYSAQLFDYGRNRFERPLPVNLGFAGFRLHYPLNEPRLFDELISFIGASYFRVLGRGQKYGLSARGLSLNAGQKDSEEFPAFREFWIEAPAADADRVIIYALMDSASLTGAFRFQVYPGDATVVDVTATLHARKRVEKVGLAPLTSMFFTGENDRRYFDDFRTELHDSDGLLVHTGAGEWLWRPLRNPKEPAISAFVDKAPRGFGLIQRDRVFEHYQDLDLNYELRPSYWIEPEGDWGEGHIELIELPTTDETNDNVVALWAPKVPLEPGREAVFRYRLSAMMDTTDLHPGGHVLNTYQAKPKALGSGEQPPPGARRFIVDFTGGDLDYHLGEADKVELVPTISQGRVLRSFIVPNPKIEGFRAFIDVALEPGQSADLRAFLRSGSKALTETWTYPYKAE